MKKSILLLTTLGLLTAAELQASKVRGGAEVHISEPVSGNLYTAGGEIHILAPVGGDLVCAGGEVWVNAPVGADLLIAGGEVKIQSTVGGDLRLASGEATLTADVAGDLIIAGGELTIPENITIHGDVYIAGGKVIFDGTAQGNVEIVGGEVIFNGTAQGNFIAKGGKLYINGEVKGKSSLAAEQLNIGKEAYFYNNVAFWNGKGDTDFEGHLEKGASATYNEELKFKSKIDREVVKKGFAAFAAFRFASAALLMTLLVVFFGRFFAANTGNFREQVGKYASTGTWFLIGVPFLALLAFATVIGIPIGFILMSGYSIALILANSLAAVLLTYELKKYLQRDWNHAILIVIAIGVFGALRLVSMAAIPGKLIVFATAAVAIGAIIQWMRKGWQKVDDTPNATPSNSKDEPQDLV